MKAKNLVIIFILFLLILASGLAVFLNKKKVKPAVSERPGAVEQRAEPDASLKVNKFAGATSTAPEKNIEPEKIKKTEKIELPEATNVQIEEKINAVMIIDGVKFEAAVKPGSSAYDLMSLLKAENKINFFGKNYSGLGFFVEEINGVKNNPLGKNWIYYVNGRPAPVGVSNYLIKNNDLIEWKYEKKSF